MHWSERLPRDEFESHASSEDYQVSVTFTGTLVLTVTFAGIKSLLFRLENVCHAQHAAKAKAVSEAKGFEYLCYFSQVP